MLKFSRVLIDKMRGKQSERTISRKLLHEIRIAGRYQFSFINSIFCMHKTTTEIIDNNSHENKFATFEFCGKDKGKRFAI